MPVIITQRLFEVRWFVCSCSVSSYELSAYLFTRILVDLFMPFEFIRLCVDSSIIPIFPRSCIRLCVKSLMKLFPYLVIPVFVVLVFVSRLFIKDEKDV